MKKNIKRIICSIIINVLMLLNILNISCNAACINENPDFTLEAKSALLMEFSTGNILFEKNPHEKLPPASVTKIMTMLLTMEAINSSKITLNDKVTISEYACSMGGTQLFLSPGEIRTVEELLKGVIIESANDAAVALAEYISGSEELFVKKMNERAEELNMKDTHFSNCNGLPVENHYTSANDIALMSRELLKYNKIFDYTTIWMETISEGRKAPFTMVNKNKMIKYYNGCDGLKTGSTSEAKFCISATASRDNMRLISVIVAAPTKDIRNREASKLLDFGFANYQVVKLADKNDIISEIKVLKGEVSSLNVKLEEDFNILTEKGAKNEIQKDIKLNKEVNAPIKQGEKIGEMIALKDGEVIGKVNIIAEKEINRAGFLNILERSFKTWSSFKK